MQKLYYVSSQVFLKPIVAHSHISGRLFSRDACNSDNPSSGILPLLEEHHIHLNQLGVERDSQDPLALLDKLNFYQTYERKRKRVEIEASDHFCRNVNHRLVDDLTLLLGVRFC